MRFGVISVTPVFLFHVGFDSLAGFIRAFMRIKPTKI